MSESSNNSLLGLLAVVVIIAFLAIFMLKGHRNTRVINEVPVAPSAPAPSTPPVVTPPSAPTPSPAPPARTLPNLNISIISGGSSRSCPPHCHERHQHHYNGHRNGHHR